MAYFNAPLHWVYILAVGNFAIAPMCLNKLDHAIERGELARLPARSFRMLPVLVDIHVRSVAVVILGLRRLRYRPPTPPESELEKSKARGQD
jgi:hypothetical protein